MTLDFPKSLRIGLLGFGTVGKGIFDIIESQKDYWVEELGYLVEVVAIAVKTPSKHTTISHLLVPIEKFLEKTMIDLIIEAIGGNFVIDILLQAMKQGIDVITANKEVISNNFDILNAAASRYNIKLMYEACVGSSIPIIKILQEQQLIQEITYVSGILNGTCNYILSQIENNQDFENALKKAQKLGFAEFDPSNDIDGVDSAFKLTILASICSKKQIDLKDVEIKGIREITTTDINEAKMNYKRIKLVATYNPSKKIPLSVGPMLIDPNHPFYNIENEENAIIVSGNYSGDLILKGKGAGRYPAASAISQDLTNYIKSELIARKLHL